MLVSWTYTPPQNRKKRSTEEEEYKVEVQVEYKKPEEEHFSVFPPNGSLLAASLVGFVIRPFIIIVI